MRTFGRYQIVREIGRGALGRVYLAHDPEIDRSVAIKTIQVIEDLLPEVEPDEVRRRFVREARAAGKLLHPSIVTIFDAGEENGIPYLAMEYVEGTTLDHHTGTENALPVAVVVELVAAAAEGLAHAHKSGLVHRDIKPSNLMRVGERAVKIMDFGLARAAMAHLTQDGSLLGTPHYMSPEQVRGAPPDGRSDLFSLSVVLYELLLGQKPFGGDSVSSVLYRIVHEEPADPGSPHPRLAPPVATFLRRALAKAPEARPPDGETFATELRRAAKTPDGTVVSDIEGEGWEAGSIPPREEARPHGSNVAFWGTVGVIVLAGAAAASWYAVKGPPSPPPPPEWVSTVRTEPPGLPVYRDGEPLAEPEVRFTGAAPFPVLTLDTGCRTLRYEVTPEDAGREIVLVPDPTETPVVVESDHEQASVILNGEPVGSPGVPLRLDLCRENRIELAAEGYRDDSVSIPAGATPLEARTAAASLSLDPLPTGTLVLTDPGYRVRWSVNGEGVSGRSPRLELSEGRYRIRAVSEPEWVDVTADVTVKPNETVTADLGLPRLGRLRVQAFPANARVYARRGDSPWRLLDDAPLDVRLAVGAYRIRVEFLPSGKRVEKRVEVRAVDDPPVRVGIAEAE